MPEIAEEHKMLQELVRKFVDEELMPLEKNVLEREASGGVGGLSEEEEEPLFAKCKELLMVWVRDVEMQI